MKTRIIEATNGFNWGKFMLGRFEEEYDHRSPISPDMSPMARWDRNNMLVLDLATGEGAIFRIGGSVEYDLNQKHKIWVCPMYQPFLEWLYKQPHPFDLEALPAVVNVDPEGKLSSLQGYRRTGGQIRLTWKDEEEVNGVAIGPVFQDGVELAWMPKPEAIAYAEKIGATFEEV